MGTWQHSSVDSSSALCFMCIAVVFVVGVELLLQMRKLHPSTAEQLTQVH